MLLSTKLSNDQTLYQFLQETKTPLSIIANPNTLNQLITNHNLKALDFSSEDSQKEIAFVAFLKETYADNFTETYHWDYRDELSATKLETLLKKALDNERSFKTETEDYLFDVIDWYPDYDIINQFYEQHPNIDEDDDFYLNLFDDYVDVDLNIDTLLQNSAPEDMTIYFGQTWDDDYDCIEERYNNDNTSITTPIEWLIQTQDYQPEDLFNTEILNKSTFLTSLKEELYDYDTDLTGMQLIAIPDSNDFDAILAIARKEGIIKASTRFGLFNRIHGSGSGLSIELEKDIPLNPDTPLYEITLASRKSPYDYSPDPVYGLVRKKYTGDDLSENKDN